MFRSAWAVIGGLAAVSFGFAGLGMITLRSEAGNTVAEYFYNAMGFFSLGMASIPLLLLVGIDRLERRSPRSSAVAPPDEPPGSA